MYISFKQNNFQLFPKKIIDSHGHIGKFFDGLHNRDTSLLAEQILDTVELQNSNVEKVLISNINGLNSIKSQNAEIITNKEIFDICKTSGKQKLFPLAICQPHNNEDVKNIAKALDESKFYGLKFHPSLTKFPILNNEKQYLKYLDFANKKNLPCVFHAASDGFSEPSKIIELAKNYPNLPVVLYHIDLTGDKIKAIDDIAKSLNDKSANLYADISWISDKNLLKHAIKNIGEDRLLFGSDTPIAEMGKRENYENQIKNITEAVQETFQEDNELAQKAIDKIFYGNANKLFFSDKKINTLC